VAVRRVTCYVAICDLCGNSTDFDGGTPHLDSPDEAIEYVTENAYDERSGWTLTPAGRLVCDGRTDTAHENAHAAAGKRMGADAMTATFTHA
jgi:hypothetical protein